uniref:Uncharacterized protein n=1 Tax=Mycena chlorophos TaxID=658473 RepID=A0ABQ0KV63_MYCCL|nr:predicted protein [Mycena chlorophos]
MAETKIRSLVYPIQRSDTHASRAKPDDLRLDDAPASIPRLKRKATNEGAKKRKRRRGALSSDEESSEESNDEDEDSGVDGDGVPNARVTRSKAAAAKDTNDLVEPASNPNNLVGPASNPVGSMASEEGSGKEGAGNEEGRMEVDIEEHGDDDPTAWEQNARKQLHETSLGTSWTTCVGHWYELEKLSGFSKVPVSA